MSMQWTTTLRSYQFLVPKVSTVSRYQYQSQMVFILTMQLQHVILVK